MEKPGAASPPPPLPPVHLVLECVKEQRNRLTVMVQDCTHLELINVCSLLSQLSDFRTKCQTNGIAAITLRCFPLYWLKCV